MKKFFQKHKKVSILSVLLINFLIFPFAFHRNSLAADPVEEYFGKWLALEHGIENNSVNRQIAIILKRKLKLNDEEALDEFKQIYGNLKNSSIGDFKKKVDEKKGLKTKRGIWTREQLGYDVPLVNKANHYVYFQPNGSQKKINGMVSEEDEKKFLEEQQLVKAKKVPKELQLPALEVTYQNPLNVNSFTALIGNFLAKLQAIIGWLAVIMIVIGGLVYITSTGRSAQIELGKKIITYALIGFAIAVAAPSILKEIVELARSSGSGGGDVIRNAKPIKAIIESALNFILVVFGIIATISFAISGILFILAGGDTGRGEKARKGLFYSIIGVVVAGASLIIVKQVFALIGG